MTCLHQFDALRYWSLVWVVGLCAGAVSAEPEKGLPGLGIPESFGVNIHFTRADAKELAALQESGSRFIRMDFSWGGTERKKGEYDFSAYDGLVADMGKLGIRCLFILDYGNRLYDEGVSPHSAEAQGAFAKWAGAAAKHFAGKGVLWEIWNEPNIPQFWKPKPNAEDYSRLALATIEAVRTADANAFILGPASSTFPWEFFETMGKNGVFARLDAASVHPYRQQIPETAESDYCRLRLLLAKHAPGKTLPIVSGEWGYSTAWASMDEEKQANYIVRQRLMNLWMGVPLSIWYDWKDDGPDPKEPEHHFGTVYQDLKPKASYVAGKTLAETLKGYTFVRRMATENLKDYVLIFRKDRSVALAAWSIGESHTVNVDVPAGPVTIVARDGRRETAQAEGNGLAMEVGASPRYVLLGDSEPASRLGNWKPGRTMNVVGKEGVNSIEVVIENADQKPMDGELRVTVDQQVIGSATVRVGRGERKAVTIPLDYTRRDQGATMAHITFKTDGKEAADSAWVWLLRSNPLRTSILPAFGEHVTVLVENPSGEPAKATLHVTAGDLSATAPMELKEKQTEAAVTVKLPGAMPAGAMLEVVGRDGSGRVMIQPKGVRWQETASPNAGGEWKASVEGDTKVAAEAKASVVDVKAGLPQGGMSKAVELNYQLGKGWRYVAMMPPSERTAIEGMPKTVGMWVYGDGSGNVLRCRFRDSSGQTFQPTYGAMNWTGWKWITMPLDAQEAGHWGGAKDGVIHYPIQWDAVLLVDSANEKVDQPLTLQAARFAVGY